MRIRNLLLKTMTACSLAVLSVCNAPAGAGADQSCVDFQDNLQTAAPTPFGPFNGVSSITMGTETTGAQFITILSGSCVVPKNIEPFDCIYAALWLFPTGDSLTAIDKLTIAFGPNPGEFILDGSYTFTGGTGRFAKVSGKARLQGTATASETGATTTRTVLTGRLCGI